MIVGPRSTTSPVSPAGSRRPCSSITPIASTMTVGRPHDSSRWRSSGSRTAAAISAGDMKVVGNPDSVWPKAWQTTGPRRCTASAIFSGAKGDAAEIAQAVREPSLRHRLLSCGRPTVIVEAMGIMDEQGRLLPPGETGEVVLRGPTIMDRYLDDEAATAEIQQHGWHHTGDIGRRDEDGYFYITDRKRDLIISGGFNIFPFEVESALMQHPSVQDCAVIGVPDPKWGEAVKACVQLKPGAQASADELIAWARGIVGAMKAPKSVDFIASLPRSPVGKVLKRELRAPWWAGQGRGVG